MSFSVESTKFCLANGEITRNGSHGPRAGLALLGTLGADARMAHTHRLEAVRAHLLEQAGDTAAARASYLRAARMTGSLPEQRSLTLRAARPR